MLLLSVIGLVVPAVFHRLAHGSGGNGVELKLDTEIAVVLFVTYCASLVFTLRTHRDLYRVTAGDDDPSEGGHGMSLKRAVIVLFASTAAVAVVSELLVSSVSETAGAFLGGRPCGGRQDGRGNRDRGRVVDPDCAVRRANPHLLELCHCPATDGSVVHHL
jgi:Ca2+:H+ antiporter